jgi:hypothetical protein
MLDEPGNAKEIGSSIYMKIPARKQDCFYISAISLLNIHRIVGACAISKCLAFIKKL